MHSKTTLLKMSSPSFSCEGLIDPCAVGAGPSSADSFANGTLLTCSVGLFYLRLPLASVAQAEGGLLRRGIQSRGVLR